MKQILFGLIIFFWFQSCKANKEKRIHIGDFDLVGNFVSDTVPNGTIKFYDTLNKLVAIRNYTRGVLNGNSMGYYNNGNVHDSSFFIYDFKNGYDYLFDSLGYLKYKANYFFGKQIGPVYTYDRLKNVIEYSFNNFEDDILYYYQYDTVIKKANYPDDKFLIKASTSEYIRDGQEGVKIFLYLFQPPHLKLSYKICHFNKANNVVDSFIVPMNNFYFEKFYKLPPDSLKIGILINKYDSLSKKEIVIMEQLKTTYP
jgi:hypothetical protein